MKNDYKIDIGSHGFKEEPEMGILSSKLLLDEEADAESGNHIGIHEQEKISINNYSTNAGRRALSDRCEINHLICSFKHQSCLSLFISLFLLSFMSKVIVYNVKAL